MARLAATKEKKSSKHTIELPISPAIYKKLIKLSPSEANSLNTQLEQFAAKLTDLILAKADAGETLPSDFTMSFIDQCVKQMVDALEVKRTAHKEAICKEAEECSMSDKERAFLDRFVSMEKTEIEALYSQGTKAAIAEAHAAGFPTTHMDEKGIYDLYPDGHKEYIEEERPSPGNRIG